MSRTFIGIDSTGVPCLKVTKDSADDPKTTVDADRHKFLYNSKDHKVAETAAVRLPVVENTGAAPFINDSWVFEGGAGTATDFVTAYVGDGTAGKSLHTAEEFPYLDYDCPLVDFKVKDASGKGIDLTYFGGGAGLSSGGGYDVIGGRPDNIFPHGAAYYYPSMSYAGQLGGNEYRFIAATGYSHPHIIRVGGYMGHFETTPALFPLQSNIEDSTSDVAIVWNLPGDNTPLLQEAPAATTPGQKVIEINQSSLKIAKPGYDVDTATKEQLAFAAEKRPVKVIASGDIMIAASSTTTYDIGFSVDASVYLDVQYYGVGEDLYYPASPSISLYGAKYYVSGSTIYFENSGVACRARFIVIAVDALGPTAGANKVLRTIGSGGEIVTQLLAPGSADPPRLSDIVVDSRWPTMPILAEGYLSVTGIQAFTINFDNLGLKPFVKLSVLRSHDGRVVATSPTVRRLRRTGWTDNMGGDTVFARVAADNQVVISAYKGNPDNAFLSSNGVVVWYIAPVVGIRYYVFGVHA